MARIDFPPKRRWQPHVADHPQREPRHEPETAVCTGCGAVLARGRWTYDEERREQLVLTEAARDALCPGCARAREALPEGVLRLHGPFVIEHREEMLRTLWNQAKETNREDPTQRLIDVHDEDDEVVAWTTTPGMAQRLGRVLTKAFNGEMTQVFSRGDRLLRVDWKR